MWTKTSNSSYASCLAEFDFGSDDDDSFSVMELNEGNLMKKSQTWTHQKPPYIMM